MDKRWLIGGAVVALSAGYFLFHGHDDADAMTPKSGRDGKVAMQVQRNADVPAPVAVDPLAPHPAKKFVKPVMVYNPKNNSYEMPMIDAVPDPEGEAKEQMIYKMSRMRLGVNDEAARCYSGPDARDEIVISYKMVVDKEVLRADNVQLVETHMDPGVTSCIMNAIRDMRQLDEGAPDMSSEVQEYRMTAHDLYVSNRRDSSNTKHSEDTFVEGVDKPAVVPTPLPEGASSMPKPGAGQL